MTNVPGNPHSGRFEGHSKIYPQDAYSLSKTGLIAFAKFIGSEPPDSEPRLSLSAHASGKQPRVTQVLCPTDIGSCTNDARSLGRR